MEELASAFFRHPLLLVGNGQLALYLILQLLKEEFPRRSVVIMPAYTAPSVYVSIRAAGLTPLPVDIDPSNLEYLDSALEDALKENDVLALLRVHPFGVALPLDLEVRHPLLRERGIAVVEDAAQSLGAKIQGRLAGTISGLGFGSLNRGKNLPVEGGALLFCSKLSRRRRLQEMIAELERPPQSRRGLLPLYVAAYVTAICPRIYGPAQSLISTRKQLSPPSGVECLAFSNWQARLLTILLPRLAGWNQQRRLNALHYQRAFSGLPRLQGLRISRDSQAAWNRFPLLLSDGLRRRVQEKLSRVGIEASTLYQKAIPDHFPKDCPAGEYAGARRYAAELLTLPVQAGLLPDDRERIIRTVLEAVNE